ncbi:MAG: STAS domain-containing protein [Terriglobales bacterium]
MIKVTCRRIDSVTVVDLGGRITLGEGATVLRETIRDLLAKGENQILLNLGDVSYIDSSGLGELVGGFSLVRKSGGDLKLLKLTRKVHDLLQITKLYTVFDVQDDEARAIATFAAPDAPAEASRAH